MTANPKYRAVFERLETDAEFKARAIPGNPTYVNVKTIVMLTGWYGHPYPEERIEPVLVSSLAGERLDDVVWSTFRLQRRIIEDVSN